MRGAEKVHWPTVVLAASLLAFLLVAARLAPRLPNPRFAVLIGAAVVTLLDLRESGIQTVGSIPSALPTFHLPAISWQDVTVMIGPALGIAIVGYSDNVLTARAFAAKVDQDIDANHEFLALGVANIAGGVLSGFPVSSSGSRTAIGASLRSRTQLYSLVTLATVLLAVLALAPVLAAFPKAALGALVVYAALRLIEWAEIRRIAAFRRSELLLCLATVAGVFWLGALNGILLAIALSLGDLLRRVARPHDGILGYVTGLAGMHDVADYPGRAKQVPGLVVYRYDSPLFFANAEDFRSRAMAAVVDTGTPAEWLLLNMEANTEIDITSLDMLEELRSDLADRGVIMALARVKFELHADLRRHGFAQRIGDPFVFATLPTAVAGYLDWHENKHGRPHPIRT